VLDAIFNQLGNDDDDCPLYFEKGRTTLSKEEAMHLIDCRAFAVLLDSEKTRRMDERLSGVPAIPAKPVETWYEEGCPTKEVYPIDSTYLLKSFRPKDATVLSDIRDAMKIFQLNKE